VLLFSAGNIMQAFQKHSIARVVVGIAAACFLMAALLLYIAFGSRGPKRIPWWIALVLLSAFATGLVGLIPAVHPYNNDIVRSVGLMWAIVYIIAVLRSSIKDLSEEVGTWAARIAYLFMLASSLAFPTIIIFLVTNGNTEAFIFSSGSSVWIVILEGFILVLGPMLLFMVPALAHKRLDWSTTPQLTRDVIARLLAIGAALSSGLYALLLHFDKGPLAQAHIGLGPLTAGILFAVALLVPFYQSVIKACWQRGVLHLVDFACLRAAVRDAMKAWWAAVPPGNKPEAENLEPEAGALECSHPDYGVSASPKEASTRGHPSDGRGHCAGQDHSPERREAPSE
jgi:hypothetical protein